jgi:serine/threonine-protein phosphatase 2A regulatory subunit B
VICFNKQPNDLGQEEFEYMTEFQAHIKSFDTLSSSEIAESITDIEWINNHRDQKPAVLVSNSRTVNLLRIVGKKVIKTESIKRKFAKGEGICMPRTKVTSESKEGKLIASFKTGKELHLHSISMCPDRENFLTSDENRVNLWNLDRAGAEVYSLIDYNRQKLLENEEAITCARFNTEGLMFLYATNKGHIRLCDLRESSNFHKRPSMEFALSQRSSAANMFDKWLNVISSASFVPGSHTVLSRDFLSAKLWDMRMGGSSSMIVDTGNAAKPIYSA